MVTGAAQGLGEALARRPAADAVERDAGRRTGAVQANVASEADVQNMVAAVQGFGKLDILIANAGVLRAHDVTEFPLNEWKMVLDINLTGYFLCAQAAARAMIPHESGTIIQINSIRPERIVSELGLCGL